LTGLPVMCDRVIKWGLAGLAGFTPLAFGTVEPWSVAFMEWGIVTLSLLFLLRELWPSRDRPVVRGRWSGLEIPMGLFLVLGLLQLVPLPRTWLHRLSPGSARLYEAGELEAWRAIEVQHLGTSGDAGISMPVHEPIRRAASVQPRKTEEKVILFACLAALFFLVSWWVDRPARALFLMEAVTLVGFLVALEGLVQFLTWNGKIYWVRTVPPSSAFGPFVNHNHFAGYVEMVIPVAITLAFYIVEIQGKPGRTWIQRGSARPDVDPPGGDMEGSGWVKAGLAVFAAILLVVTLLLSLSRGGILSFLLSGFLLFTQVLRRMSLRAVKWAVALILPLAVLGLLAWIGGETVTRQMSTFRKLESESTFTLRSMIWQTVLHEWPAYAWVGSGFGTFEDSFAPFTPPGTSRRWDKAHNDYLQFLWETGIIGSVLLLFGIGVFVRRYWWPALRSRDHPLDLLRVGVATSLLSIALHSVVDFNLQIGANAFLSVLLAGMMVALHRIVHEGSGGRPVLVGGSESPR
jgi:O-antigen ligase